ncbi:putative Protein kinase domain containing protein [Blattamonas nauphoetae]|uniref:mitogen-activated protein kinase kinase n=1 Tax=Blattamonas nauphoetae TaxID=2049346 RepID=A0ABQ9XRD6_9EUKA|nr:putative Protein kinase domain containing protein [Blattamonas nauphoetae]
MFSFQSSPQQKTVTPFGKKETVGDPNAGFAEMKRTLPKDLMKDPTSFLGKKQALIEYRCPYIVQVTAIDETETDIEITEEHISTDSLNEYLGQVNRMGLMISEEKIWDIVGIVALSLKKLLEKGFMHGNLKPSNVFLMKDCVGKLGDFFLWNEIKDPISIMVEKKSELGYLSPEQINGEGEITIASDIYALGLIIAQAVGKAPLYKTTSLDELKEKYASPPPSIQMTMYSENLQNTLTGMINRTASERITLEKILEIETVKNRINMWETRLGKLPVKYTYPKERPPKYTDIPGPFTFKIANKDDSSDPHYDEFTDKNFSVNETTVTKEVNSLLTTTFYLDKPFTSGIVSCSFSFQHSEGSMYVGISSNPITQAGRTWIGENPESLRYMFSGKVIQNGKWVSGCEPFSAQDVVTLEANMEKRTLHIFKSDVLQPVYFTNIPEEILFGFCLVRPKSSCEVSSLCTLEFPSPDIDRGVENMKGIEWDYSPQKA